MKKRLVLLPLLLSLTACSGMNLNSYMNNNGNGANEASNPAGASSKNNGIVLNDTAINVLNSIAIFPEVGDSVDLTEYITFDETWQHTIDEYQFTSSDPEVIKIEGYSAACLKEGYSDIAIQGPGINQDTSLSFYVGSIAGKYVPENKGLADLVSFEIGEINNNEQRISNFTLTIKEGKFKKTQLKPYTGSGSFLKGSPFLALEFEEDAPKYFKPVTDYLELFGIDEDLNIDSNVYGILACDAVYGVYIQTFFLDSSVVFFLED